MVIGALTHPASQQVYAAIALLLAFCLLYRYSLRSLSEDERYLVRLNTLRLQKVPNWVPPEHPVRVRLSARYRDGVPIFHPSLVQDVTRAYLESPWIKRVIHVRKQYPNHVLISVEVRKPVALVAVRPGGYVMVDGDGVRLPGHYAKPPAIGLRLPIIAGAMVAPPRAGEIWRDHGVADGARLAHLWNERGLMRPLDMQRIDVHNVGGRVDRRRSEVVMYLASDTPLRWGRVDRPGRADPIDYDDEHKIAILRSELIGSGRLREDPQLSFIRYLDIQHGQLRIIRR